MQKEKITTDYILIWGIDNSLTLKVYEAVRRGATERSTPT